MRSTITLPEFKATSEYTLIDAVTRYVKSELYPRESITIDELTKLLFVAQGCTRRRWGLCFKTVPSAGATFPLEVYAICHNVENVKPAIYAYSSQRPLEGELEHVAPIDSKLQIDIPRALDVVIVAHYERTTRTYGRRGYRYVYNEVGHCIQNIILESALLGISCDVKVIRNEGERESIRTALRTEGDPLAVLRVGVPIKSSKSLGIGEGRQLTPLEKAIINRRSIRSYSKRPLSLEQLMLILKYSIGFIDKNRRSYPRLNDSYLVNCIVLVGNVEGLEKGLYRYNSHKNELELIRRGYYLDNLYGACLYQDYVRDAQCDLVFTMREGADPFLAHVETGAIGQNVYLLAASLDLGTVAIGAFYDDRVKSIIDVDILPTYVMPIGTL
ncbi:MAG: hypothetical protein DRJ49_02745 [Thermoprotei archaeon]|nr:MAG: hypothetical protein DRJ49_02745 [Thermoprotei archaeon]